MKGPMKIGFDMSQTGDGKAGCGYYAYGMMRALSRLKTNHQFTLYPTFGDINFDPKIRPFRSTNRNFVRGPRHRTAMEAAIFWRDSNVEGRLDVDLVHSNNFWLPKQLKTTRLVYTLYDLSFLESPDWTTEANRIVCFEGLFNAAISADFLIAISSSTRDHFLRIFPSFPHERIRVIYPCSRFDTTSAKGVFPRSLKHVRPGRYWLSVGTIEPRKNYVRLVEAYAHYLKRGGPPMPLVIAGGSGWMMEGFDRRLKELGVSDEVIMAGYIKDDELIWLYRNCYANVYVSLFEGFGLPVLEGMQFGAATIASRTSSIPEITGDAAILVDPLETTDIAKALLALGGDSSRRHTLSKLGHQRAKKFRWENSTQQLLQVYREVTEAPKRQMRTR